MKFKFYYLLFLSVFLGCSDEDSPAPAYYIELNTNKGNYLFTEDIGVFNQYFIGENQDQLSLVLANNENFFCEIHIMATDLLNKNTPYELPSTVNSGYAEIQVIDLNHEVASTFSPDDDVNYLGITFEQLRVVINSFDNGVISGTLSGAMQTKTGKVDLIKKGEFRVPYKVVTVD